MPNASPLRAAAAGAALVGAAWAFTAWSGDAGSRPVELERGADHAASNDGTRAILERLERIEARLTALGSARPGARPIAAEPSRGPVLEGTRPVEALTDDADAAMTRALAETTSEALITDEVLERTLERMEAKRLDAYSNTDLRAQAQRLMNKERDLVGAKRLLDHLLARDLEPLERVEVLTDRGAAERGLGDNAASEGTLREAMRLGGTDTVEGVSAGYHLVWTLSRGERPGQALALADDLLSARGLSDTMRPWMRWAGAKLALQTGDTSRARADYQALLNDVRDTPMYSQIAKDAATQLAALE